jgi:hypothetical protein
VGPDQTSRRYVEQCLVDLYVIEVFGVSGRDDMKYGRDNERGWEVKRVSDAIPRISLAPKDCASQLMPTRLKSTFTFT